MLSSIANYYERPVIERIQQVLTERRQTLDRDRIADLACLALNRLPPRYVVHIVDLNLHLSDDEHAQVLRQVEEAVDFAFATLARRQRGADGETL